MKRADRKKFHYIYKITRHKDSKYYIGMHSTDDLDDNYFGSGTKIRRSINKYGINAHTKEIIEFLPNREALRNREAEIVNENCINDPLCMNIVLGGRGGWPKDGTHPMQGKHHTEETKKILSEKSKANFKPRFGTENPMFGKTGINHHNYGRKLDETTKEKISKKIKGIKHSTTFRKRRQELSSGANNPKAKTFIITSPDNISYEVKGSLEQFCNDHGLSMQTLSRFKEKGPVILTHHNQLASYLSRNTIGWMIIEVKK